MSLGVPTRFYDYVLYYECGINERLSSSYFLPNKVGSLSAGSLGSYVKWNASGNNVGDGAGITRFGVTSVAITAYKNWSHNTSYSLNSYATWKQIVGYFWSDAHSYECANYACGVLLCQGKWGGWSSTALKKCCSELAKNADKSTSGISLNGSYSSIAKLTNCFSNPMNAFVIIRNCRISYLRSCGNASKFAGGWMRREFFAMQEDGLYIEPGTKSFTTYGTASIATMKSAASKLKSNSSSGYVKLMSWDGTPDIETDDGTVDVLSSSGDSYSSNVYQSPVDGGILSTGLNSKNKTVGTVLGLSVRQKTN